MIKEVEITRDSNVSLMTWRGKGPCGKHEMKMNLEEDHRPQS